MAGITHTSGSGYPPVRGTTPLDPSILAETTGPTRTGETDGPAEAVETAVDAAASEVQVRAVESDSMSETVAFPGVSATEQTRLDDVNLLLNGLPENLSEEQITRFNELAADLGYNGIEMLQHHMRNLKTDQKQALISQLRTAFAQSPAPTPGPDGRLSETERVTEANQLITKTQGVFENFFTQAVAESFQSVGASQPIFQVPEGQSTGDAESARWDTASLSSVFNAIEQIRQQDPERLALIGREPVTFNRYQDPQIHTTDNFMNVLTQATAIASTQADSRVINLYGTAVSGDHTEITGRVVDQLDLVTRVVEDPKTGRPLVDPHTGYTVSSPLYTTGELESRGLSEQPDDTRATHRERLVDTLLNNYTRMQFNAETLGDSSVEPSPEGVRNLQEAVNFIIGFRGLDIPRIDNYDGDINNRQLRYALGALQTGFPKSGTAMLQQIAARAEQQQGMRNIQQFLVDNAPPGAETIDVDGILGGNTRDTVRAFEVGLAMNTLKERIEDDPQLPEHEKVGLLADMNEQFRELASHPDQCRQILANVQEILRPILEGSDLAPHTRAGMEEDLGHFEQMTDGRFDRETTEYLVSNWLNVMDSGQGVDLAEQLVMHETSHIWDTALNQENPSLRIAENWAKLFDPALQGSGGFSTHQMNTSDYHERLHDDLASSSDYGSISPREDFAEATRIFSYDPQRLMRRSLMKFLFINALSSPEHRYDAESIRSMAHESGYSDDQIRTRLNTLLGHNTSGNNVAFTQGMSGMLNRSYSSLSNALNSSAVMDNPSRISFADIPLSDEFSLGDYSLERPAFAPPPALGTSGMYQFQDVGPPNLELGWQRSNSLLPDNWSLLSSRYTPQLTLETPSVLRQSGLSAIPPPEENESGYILDALSERYSQYLEIFTHPNANMSQRMMASRKIEDIMTRFVEEGPTAVAGDLRLPQTSIDAMEAAIDRRFPNGATAQQRKEAYAVMATLAMARSTGQVNPQSHGAVAENLPDAFSGLMQRPDMQEIFAPGNIDLYAPTYLFEGTLSEMDWTAERLDAASQSTNKAHSSFMVMQALMNNIPDLPPNYKHHMESRNLSQQDAFRVAEEMLALPAVNDFFDSNQGMMEMLSLPVRSAVASTAQALGLPQTVTQSLQEQFGPEQVKRLVLAAHLSQQSSQADFSQFISQQLMETVRSTS